MGSSPKTPKAQPLPATPAVAREADSLADNASQAQIEQMRRRKGVASTYSRYNNTAQGGKDKLGQ